jgi:hypothetical protein
MVERAHRNQLAMRFEVSALEAAVAAGHTTVPGQYAYALTWLAERAAERETRLDAERNELREMLGEWQQIGRKVAKDAARTAGAAGPATPVPNPPSVAGHTTSVEWVDEADNDWGRPRPVCEVCGGTREHVLGCPEMDAPR